MVSTLWNELSPRQACGQFSIIIDRQVEELRAKVDYDRQRDENLYRIMMVINGIDPDKSRVFDHK